jgi:putative inorganic carbon (hco3(-)) transporter
VAIYGILEHFGIDKNLWVQDVQSRVFSTLGQPNWLAAYLAILLPLSLYKYFESLTIYHQKTDKINGRIIVHPYKYLFITTSFYLCLLFTKSKSGILATVISLAVFFLFKVVRDFKKKILFINLKSYIVFLIFIFLSLIIRNPIRDLVFFQKPDNLMSENLKSNTLITPSSDIRKIVWKGSIDLFKKFPILGTGVETFAYSYYWTRPIEHNLTSEWDFLYNKAHNEYLNYLATTGLTGFIPYIVLILAVLFLLIKNSIKNSNLDIRNLSVALLASYVSILITNAAGFSVVIVSIYFFLLPTFLYDNTSKSLTKPRPRLKYLIPALFIIYIILVRNIIFSYVADIYFAKYESSNSRQEYQSAHQHISKSIFFRPNEPNYLISLATAAAKMSVLTKDQLYIDQAINSSKQATKISPSNINYLKQQAQVYYYLSVLDTQHFISTIESMLQASKLAPTDAKIPYSLGQFLESAELFDDALYYYQKAVDLKPNYDHAYFALGKIYYEQQKFDLAKKNLELNLLYAPTNTEAQEMLKKIPN